jgi:hypothetical protein
MRGRSRAFILLVVVCGCATPPDVVPLHITTIAVFPPVNRTGDDLLVSGGSMLGSLLEEKNRVTVMNLLAGEARFQLARDGFTVVSPEVVDKATQDLSPPTASEAAAVASKSDIDAAVLHLGVRVWEPDPPMVPSKIIVAVDGTLIDSKTGRTLWTSTRAPRPVSTAGAVIFGDACVIAAHLVMESMLGGLRPERGF